MTLKLLRNSFIYLIQVVENKTVLMREESPREKRLSIPSMGVLQIPSENKTHTMLKVKYH